MGPNVNTGWADKDACITDDGKYFFFINDRRGPGTQPDKLWKSELLTNLEPVYRVDAYWVETSIIEDLKHESGFQYWILER